MNNIVRDVARRVYLYNWTRRCFCKLLDLNGSTTEIWYDLFTFLMDFLLRNNDNSGWRLVLFVYLFWDVVQEYPHKSSPPWYLQDPDKPELTLHLLNSLLFISLPLRITPSPQLMLVSVANPCSTLFSLPKFSLWRELFDPLHQLREKQERWTTLPTNYQIDNNGTQSSSYRLVTSLIASPRIVCILKVKYQYCQGYI